MDTTISNQERKLSAEYKTEVPTFLMFGLYKKIVKLEDELLKSKLH